MPLQANVIIEAKDFQKDLVQGKMLIRHKSK
jgi:hypothetical protein